MVTLDQAGWIGTDAVLRPGPAQLADLVEHVFMLDLRRAPHRSWLILPDYCGHVIIHVDDDEPAVRAFLVGPRSSSIEVDVSRRAWTLGVRFTPGALPVLTGIPAPELRDASVSFGDVWGHAGARLDARLSCNRTPAPDVLLDEVISFLSDLVPAARERDWYVRGMARHLTGARPALRIAEVASRLGVSERGLRSRSTEMIGLAPKRVARTHRLFRAIDRARRMAVPDWASIATEAGFADQAHMTREFGALVGETPVRFHARGRTTGACADSFNTDRTAGV